MMRFMTNRFEILVKPNAETTDIRALIQKLGPCHAHVARGKKRDCVDYAQTSDGAFTIVCTNSEKRNVDALLHAIAASGFMLADKKFQAPCVPIATALSTLAAGA